MQDNVVSQTSVNLETGEIKSKSEWNKDEITIHGDLDIIKNVLGQLQFYLKMGRYSSKRHIERDIEGYRVVLETGNDDLARLFLDTKQEAKPRFKDNLAVIAHMKKIGIWKI